MKSKAKAGAKAPTEPKTKAPTKLAENSGAISGQLTPVGAVPAEDLIPPALSAIVSDVLPKRHSIGDLSTLSDVKSEMARVYRRMWLGQLTLSQGTRIFYMLDKLQKTISARIALGEIDGDDRGAWTGVTLIGVDKSKWASGQRLPSSVTSPPAASSSPRPSSASTPRSSQGRS